jgi:hypothetical protein
MSQYNTDAKRQESKTESNHGYSPRNVLLGLVAEGNNGFGVQHRVDKIIRSVDQSNIEDCLKRLADNNSGNDDYYTGNLEKESDSNPPEKSTIVF